MKKKLKIVDYILVITLFSLPALSFAKTSSSVTQLLEQVYGNYDAKRNCWVLPSEEDTDSHYCMNIIKSDIVNTQEGKRNYLVLASNLLGKSGQDNGGHVSQGKVGLFVINMKDKKIVAAEPIMRLGTSGSSPDEWDLLKLAPSDYWGWKTTEGDCHQGYCGSRTLIFAPYGKTGIKSLAAITTDYSDDGAGGSTEISATIDVDNSQVDKRVFPLKMVIKGSVNGNKLKNKMWKVPFDTKKWEYKEPKNSPLYGRDF